MMSYNKSEAAMEARKRYKASKESPISVALNRTTDADIIDWLSLQKNKAGYIKSLIRADIAREKEGKG